MASNGARLAALERAHDSKCAACFETYISAINAYADALVDCGAPLIAAVFYVYDVPATDEYPVSDDDRWQVLAAIPQAQAKAAFDFLQKAMQKYGAVASQCRDWQARHFHEAQA